jgi:hypothetical protein
VVQLLSTGHPKLKRYPERFICGKAQDITVDASRIESLFPANEALEQLLRGLPAEKGYVLRFTNSDNS